MKDFKYYLETIGEYGEVVELMPSLVTVAGLPHARPFEIVLFESGTLGQVFSIGRNGVEVVVFSKAPVTVGERVARTNEILSIELGEHLLGSVISPLGDALFGNFKKSEKTERRFLEGITRGITDRAAIKRPLYSGITLVDLMLPLGKGQKQLVIGDRKTGKTSFLLTTVKNQVRDGSIVIYAAIARKQSDTQKLLQFFKKEGIEKNVVTVLTTSYDSPALIYLTPFAAMTIAEYFRDKGTDVLVVYDDLSSHAKFYREISLVGKRFPGRESYPGDIFYTHSRLMERAGNFKIGTQGKQGNQGEQENQGKQMKEVDLTDSPMTQSPDNLTREVAISCLPVVETVESDLTGYIATNIMSMTDGHIFFDQGTFAQGRRPAINIPLSVTRVGRQAQSALKRDINQKLTAFLSSFDQMQNLSHFGAELSGKVQNVLKTGEKIFALFKQSNHVVIDEEAQLVLFALIWSNILEQESISQARDTILKLSEDPKNVDFFKSITAADTLDQLLVQVNQHKEELMTMLAINPAPQPTPASPASQEAASGQNPQPASAQESNQPLQTAPPVQNQPENQQQPTPADTPDTDVKN